MPRLALIVLLLFAPLLFAQDDRAAANAQEIAELISRLASDDWRTRERASRDLVGIGEQAREALRKALTHDDPEVRVRASAALIRIGETFSFAVQCAAGDDEHLAQHGRASLMSLFRIDDPKVLRELTAREMQVRGYSYGPGLNIIKPPLLALAQLTAASGLPILVSDDAQERMRRILELPTMTIQVGGDAKQLLWIRDALTRAMQMALGNPTPDNALLVRPMRLGRALFLYVTPAQGGGNVAQRCGRELIAALLADDANCVRAASLLAQGAAGESESAERIRKEYAENPALTRLMWLALALGPDAATEALVRKSDTEQAVNLLGSRDWTVLDMAARFLRCLEPTQRGSVLSPTIESSSDATAVTCALWLARDCPLSDAARDRARRLLASRQDSLAAASARWFAGADELSDGELEAVWKGGENLPINTAFFQATSELISRPKISERLVERARAALRGATPTQQALAAQVLVGRAVDDDVKVVIEKLSGAAGDILLARQLIGLLQGVATLPEESEKRLLTAITDPNVTTRNVYMRALRALDPKLQLAICEKAETRLLELVGTKAKEGEEAEPVDKWKDAPAYVMLARIATLGIRAGQGSMESLDAVARFVESDNLEYAKAAGASVCDALSGDVLFQTLDEWKTRVGLVHGPAAAVEGYAEICRRAAVSKDRNSFRRAYGAAITINVPNSWQIRNELSRLQVEMAAEPDGETRQRMPATLNLSQLDVDVK
ncbi:MAG: HEAT repeat domain-containing protein [Planctomycetes bacterium]|nr:HEAT repeat domain-containing protein [Planctomycetota bacterium]